MSLGKAEYEALLRTDFMSFIEASFAELNPQTVFSQSRHLEVMASKLAQFARGEIRRLIICLPPRSLKSHSASVALSAWILGHHPTKQIICASYGYDLAEKLAHDSRNLMMTPFYKNLFPGASLSRSRSQVADFETTAGGVRMATSVGGAITGRGADFIIVDDALKPADALSETKRKAVNEWYDSSVVSRLNNKKEGGILIVMQRVHQDDLVGYAQDREHWDVVKFPAIAVEEEAHTYETLVGTLVYRRKAGDVLDPVREPFETLQTIKATLGEYHFSAQYQQDPVPREGAMIKAAWFQYYDPKGPLPRFTAIIQSWDTANKSSELNDYSVCTTWGLHNNHYYLLDVFRRRLNFPELKRAAIAQIRKHMPNRVVIEDKASGTQLIQELRQERLYQVKAYCPPPHVDKVVRFDGQMTKFEGGRVHLPSEAAWLTEYKAELLGFPGVKFDDQVDSTAQALEYFATQFRRSILEVL